MLFLANNSKMKKNFLTAAKTTLILVYIVIVAGALVRMTGSGMGCPDWPKCFGYYIPPTDIQELIWSSNRSFEAGQVIIKDEKLLVAIDDFTTGANFDLKHWREYTKHDYAIFNPTHTWIEYINRLAGALAGLATLAMAIFSFGFRKTQIKIFILSWSAVFLMAFQGWLGATVVYSVLNPVKITLHMMVALLIVALLLYVIWKANPKQAFVKFDKLFHGMVFTSLIMTLLQIILGTQVRQYVDERVKVLGYEQMALVMQNPEVTFYIHRSFSILIFLLNAALYYRNQKLNLGYKKMNFVMLFLGLEIVSGILMYYFDFVFGSQALHLIIAAILFGVQFYMWIESTKSSQKITID